MPYKAKHPCAEPGCPVLVAAGSRCPSHQLPRLYDTHRPNSAARGYGRQHQAWRQKILQRDPLCQLCGVNPATIADHITPLRLGGDWSLDNGQAVCQSCHNRKIGYEKKLYKQVGGLGL